MTHFDLLEADLARYYQLDLPDALWGPTPISVRRLGVLVRGLPVEAATLRTFTPERSWGLTEELLATLIELTDSRWMWFFDVHAKPSQSRPTPLRINRPGRPRSTPAEPDQAGRRRYGRTDRSTGEVVTYLRRFAPRPAPEVNGG